MAERHGLTALEVRVPRHQRLGLGLRERERHERERVDLLASLCACVCDVQAQRGGDLVVARAARMDLPPDRPERPFDRRVHVLVGLEDRLGVVGDRREPLLDLVQLVAAEEPRAVEASSMLRARLAVVGKELRVVRAEQLPDRGVERGTDAT